jgi:hypothetical protein
MVPIFDPVTTAPPVKLSRVRYEFLATASFTAGAT